MVLGSPVEMHVCCEQGYSKRRPAGARFISQPDAIASLRVKQALYCHLPAGEVFCYADADKPPLGQGLNCEAEITLLGIYKVGSCSEMKKAESYTVLKDENNK